MVSHICYFVAILELSKGCTFPLRIFLFICNDEHICYFAPVRRVRRYGISCPPRFDYPHMVNIYFDLRWRSHVMGRSIGTYCHLFTAQKSGSWSIYWTSMFDFPRMLHMTHRLIKSYSHNEGTFLTLCTVRRAWLCCCWLVVPVISSWRKWKQ